MNQIHNLSPVQLSERINSLDVIRGIALLGILLMNVNGFGLANAYVDLTNAGGSTGWNLKVWMMDSMFFEGTMRGLFTMLFGAGFILQTSRGEASGGGISVADVYYRRVLWLLLFGIVHAYLLLWFGDILYPYAIFGLMLFPVRNTNPKYLVIAGVCLLAYGSLISVKHYHENIQINENGLIALQVKTIGDSLTKVQESDIAKWEEYQGRKKSPEETQEANEKNWAGYWSIVNSRFAINQFFQTTMVYEHWVWDILPLMLLGIAFFKWGIFQGERSKRFYLLLIIIGYGIGLPVNYYETQMIVASNFDLLMMDKAEQTYHIGRVFTLFGHIGLIMLFIKSGIFQFLQNALSAVGKMALTNYLIHTVICTTVFLGFGFSMFGKLQRYELYYVVFSIWIFQLIYSPIWLRYFRYGPAEWAWRSLTYLKRQPFKR